MKKPELIELAKHITDARQMAVQAVLGVEDDGTCNMDALILDIPGTRLKTLEDLGVSCYRLRSYVAISAYFGQANRQTKGVTAMRDHLVAQGYNASIWYQMD